MVYSAQKTVLTWLTALLCSSLLLASCSDPGRPHTSAGSGDTAASGPLPYYNTPDFTPQFLKQDEAEKTITHRISNFQFTDQDGQQVTQQTVNGKIHVASFFFTACGSICPKMISQLKRVQEAFAGDTNVVLLSYSVTPWLDSVPVLQAYAKRHQVNAAQWHLLTGYKSGIYELARKSYFAEEEIGYTKDSTEFLHTEHFILVDRTSRIRGIYNGTLALETDQLIRDIKQLEKEK